MQQEERDRDIDDLVNLLEDQLFPAGFMTSFSDYGSHRRLQLQ